MTMNVAQALVRYLKEQGVRQIFGVSGHSIFAITDAIYQEPGMSFVPSQFEVAAGYMANGFARGRASLSVCLISSGGGATNVMSGVAQAYKESYPVLFISSEVERELSGKGASSWHEIPQQPMFAPITKLSVSLQRPEDTIEILEEAVRTATTGRYGPVYLGIPRDVQTAQIEAPAAWPRHAHVAQRQRADPRLIAQAADLLSGASAPSILIGGGVHFAHAEPDVIEVAELVGAPIATSTAYKGLVSEDHPLALGVAGAAAAPFANRALQESDVVLAIGTTFSEPTTLGYGRRVIPSGARIIQVDVDPAEIGKIYAPEIGIVADAKIASRQLADEIRTRGPARADGAARLQRIGIEKRQWRAENAEHARSTSGPINPWHVYHALREAIPDDALVVGEGGTMELIHRFVARGQVFHGGEFRPIGHGIATSLGLQCAFPERRVICVAGDGSFMMEMQELATAVQHDLPILVLVLRNEAYGNMKRDQLRHYDGRVIGTELRVPDLPTLASAFGAYGARIDRPADLVGAIRAALDARRPALVDVVCPIEGI
ncbi:MAG TPA: thiamine pyrophosphate-binding protein [Chloroflexota bacterium]|nr:thiamine pyrophosphate-binding protein [Chloroflexota bacterium]